MKNLGCKYQLAECKLVAYFQKLQFAFILMKTQKIDAHKLVFKQILLNTNNRDESDSVILILKGENGPLWT